MESNKQIPAHKAVDADKVRIFTKKKPLDAFAILCSQGDEFVSRNDAQAFLKHKKASFQKQFYPAIITGLVGGYAGYGLGKRFDRKGLVNGIFAVVFGSISLGLGLDLAKSFGEQNRIAMYEITRNYGNWSNDPKVIDYLIRVAKS